MPKRNSPKKQHRGKAGNKQTRRAKCEKTERRQIERQSGEAEAKVCDGIGRRTRHLHGPVQGRTRQPIGRLHVTDEKGTRPSARQLHGRKGPITVSVANLHHLGRSVLKPLDCCTCTQICTTLEDRFVLLPAISNKFHFWRQ